MSAKRFPNISHFDSLEQFDRLQAEESLDHSVEHKQSSWYFEANRLILLAHLAYSLDMDIQRSQEFLQRSSAAFFKLFALRGTWVDMSVTIPAEGPGHTTYSQSDGYTSWDSFKAACAALAIFDLSTARELVSAAGHSPSAKYVSPGSDFCSSNEQTISHALNALLDSNHELASLEARKLSFRRGTKIEKQIGLAISALISDDDFPEERDALLFYHEKKATHRDNQSNSSYAICLPALALSAIAVDFGSYTIEDLTTSNVYCPLEMFLGDP